MTGRPRVAIVQRALRRYRAGFYGGLRDVLAGEGIDLDLWHSTPAPGADPRDDALQVVWSHHLPRRTFRVGSQKLLWQAYPDALRVADLVITTQAAELLLNYRLLWHQRRDGPRVAYWGHGRNFGPRPNRFAEATKAWSSRRVHWWFAYTERSAEIVAELGYPRDRITVVDNAIDTTALRSHLEAVTAPRLAELRRELDLGHGPVGLFLGSLRADKRLDLLLDAAARVHERQEGFRLVVVGSGPQATMVRERAVREPWVRVLGSRYGRAQAELLALADLLLLPGAVGLVALDSLASATPLVASADATHGPELAYLRHRENALVVPGGDDPRRYAAAIVEALEDRSLADGLVAGCEQVADQYTLEGMIGRFSDGITRALAAPLLPR